MCSAARLEPAQSRRSVSWWIASRASWMTRSRSSARSGDRSSAGKRSISPMAARCECAELLDVLAGAVRTDDRRGRGRPGRWRPPGQAPASERSMVRSNRASASDGACMRSSGAIGQDARPRRGGLAAAREPGCASGSLAPSRGTRRHMASSDWPWPADWQISSWASAPASPGRAPRSSGSVEPIRSSCPPSMISSGRLPVRDTLHRVDGADVLPGADQRAEQDRPRAGQRERVSRPRPGGPGWPRPRWRGSSPG